MPCELQRILPLSSLRNRLQAFIQMIGRRMSGIADNRTRAATVAEIPAAQANTSGLGLQVRTFDSIMAISHRPLYLKGDMRPGRVAY
jgi:hypothetical protein